MLCTLTTEQTEDVLIQLPQKLTFLLLSVESSLWLSAKEILE